MTCTDKEAQRGAARGAQASPQGRIAADGLGAARSLGSAVLAAHDGHAAQVRLQAGHRLGHQPVMALSRSIGRFRVRSIT